MPDRRAKTADEQAVPDRDRLHSRRSFLHVTMALSSSTAVGLLLGACGAPQTTTSTAAATPLSEALSTPAAEAGHVAASPTAAATPTQAATTEAPEGQDPSTQHPQVTIPDTEVRTLRASHTGHEYRIFVALPFGYTDTDQRYPTLYLLDAQFGFGLVTEITRLLAFGEEMIPLIIIGIGYPVPNQFDTIPYRNRDLVPAAWRDDPGSDGGEAFLQFIRDDLIPFVGAEYRVHPDDRCLAGTSLAGLFGVYVLLSQPDTFTRYIIGSPSLEHATEQGAVVFRHEREYAEQHDDLPARVFMGVGTEEPGFYLTNMRKLESALQSRGYANLHLQTHIFEGETHLSAYQYNLGRGLKAVYS